MARAFASVFVDVRIASICFVGGPIYKMPWAEHAPMIALANDLIGIARGVDKSSADVRVVQQVVRGLRFVWRQELERDGGNGAMTISAPRHRLRRNTGEGERQHRKM
jgi:hypothetical protein